MTKFKRGDIVRTINNGNNSNAIAIVYAAHAPGYGKEIVAITYISGENKNWRGAHPDYDEAVYERDLTLLTETLDD